MPPLLAEVTRFAKWTEPIFEMEQGSLISFDSYHTMLWPFNMIEFRGCLALDLRLTMGFRCKSYILIQKIEYLKVEEFLLCC